MKKVLLTGFIIVFSIFSMVAQLEAKKIKMRSIKKSTPRVRVLKAMKNKHSTTIVPVRFVSTKTFKTTVAYKVDKNKDDIVTYSYNKLTNNYVFQLSQKAANLSYFRVARRSLRLKFLCDYQSISRNFSSINSTKEILIKHGDVVPPHVEAVITSCKTSSGEFLQMKLHSFVRYKGRGVPFIRSSDPKRCSVFMFGFHGMTQKAFRSVLENVNAFKNMTGWHILENFTSIGENYTSNLMALLSGHSPSSIVNTVSTESLPFIWKRYQDEGYLTAFGEDVSLIESSPFEVEEHPMSYYLRPILKGFFHTIDLNNNTKNYDKFLAAEYVFNYCEEFLKRYLGTTQPFFGLFSAKALDLEGYPNLLDHLNRMEQLGLFQETIVIFFSEHECQPLMMLWLPDWFRNHHPNITANLEANKNHFSSPYDLYLTLQHILELSKKKPQNRSPPAGCPSCLSLFEEFPKTRSCQEATNSENYCECAKYVEVFQNQTEERALGNLLVESLNQYLHSKRLLKLCETLSLNKVESVRESDHWRPRFNKYRVYFSTHPETARFVATVEYNHYLEDLESVNVSTFGRLSRYVEQSTCATDEETKKFCICKPLIRVRSKPISSLTSQTPRPTAFRNITALMENLLETFEEFERSIQLQKLKIKMKILKLRAILANSQVPFITPEPPESKESHIGDPFALHL